MRTVKDGHYYTIQAWDSIHGKKFPEVKNTGSKKDARKLAREFLKDGASHVNIYVRTEICFSH